jgi:hypothetical protein
MRRPCTSSSRKLAMLALAAVVAGWTSGSLAPAAAAPPRDEPRSSLPAVLEAAPAGTVVFDDDGGRVQVVPRRGVPPPAEVSYHGGPVVTGGTVQAIFLGSGWREAGPRGREARALEALVGGGGAAIGAALSRFGLEARELVGLAREDPLDPLAGASVSDLEVKARIDALASGEARGPRDLPAVYVVFLAPGLRSTLGVSSSEHDFAAYHNHFHAAAGVVRYVVVPYDRELSRWLEAARRSLVEVLVNPEGNGWY